MLSDATVLIVDDDEDIRETVAIALEAAGHRVASACDGIDALLWIGANGPPALILLDVMMPRMDGEQLVRALREDPALAAIPVVIMSGHASCHEKARQLTARACLVKPMDLEELEGLVARFAPLRR
jgi:CheY-like chemotaxis protein